MNGGVAGWIAANGQRDRWEIINASHQITDVVEKGLQMIGREELKMVFNYYLK